MKKCGSDWLIKLIMNIQAAECKLAIDAKAKEF
jgi:hypothetical protein